ncbi:hypothetical protein [Stenotrophomonas tuberculopleuritidis]|uniref:hypothetical protein n=1 Tax=Stenotrophomonas tuberculopleuritidis TaxID=3055079 RepID=UPI0026E51017|nr:hypothetical protein [Stenotrophomonas sp. 704A1]
MRILIPLLLSVALLAGCQRPAPPNPERPPEPQAQATASARALERAKGVQKTVDEGAKRGHQAEADAAR